MWASLLRTTLPLLLETNITIDIVPVCLLKYLGDLTVRPSPLGCIYTCSLHSASLLLVADLASTFFFFLSFLVKPTTDQAFCDFPTPVLQILSFRLHARNTHGLTRHLVLLRLRPEKYSCPQIKLSAFWIVQPSSQDKRHPLACLSRPWLTT